jgi:uncharacterized membrane protein
MIVVRLGLAAVAAAFAVAGASAAIAADAGKVKCYGIAKAGKNNCGTKKHSCAGHAAADNLPDEWVFSASAEECTKAGGKTEAPAN